MLGFEIVLQSENGRLSIEQLLPESVAQKYRDNSETHRLLLEQAVEKVVRVAGRVGVTPDEIVSLLESGMSITELLAFLASKPSGIA